METLETKIDVLVKSISEIREELQNHMQATTLRVGEIKDEISSIKRQYHAHFNDIHTAMDEISNLSKQLNEHFQSVDKVITKKLQSISDTLRTAPKSKPKTHPSNVVTVQRSKDRTTFPATQSFDVEITSPALQIRRTRQN
ncbi:hypothetical protein DPMN_008430 [Dreissena polymorpha]|uniref:Uncharacterized protein n=1 Tax=Dreissena polymorpha TaxID=45954 RepID=A0A9D4MW43_DREPO|nr:hypothetical protein DPMN_008430 [Dreissena polymorpha]